MVERAEIRKVENGYILIMKRTNGKTTIKPSERLTNLLNDFNKARLKPNQDEEEQ